VHLLRQGEHEAQGCRHLEVRHKELPDYGGGRRLELFHHCCRFSQVTIISEQQQQKRGVKKLVVLPFIVATNMPEFKIILFLNLRKKTLSTYKKIIDFSPKNFLLSFQKHMFPGSEGKLIPDPGPKGPGSGSATQDYFQNFADPEQFDPVQFDVDSDPDSNRDLLFLKISYIYHHLLVHFMHLLKSFILI
jgi:hypothetical protein